MVEPYSKRREILQVETGKISKCFVSHAEPLGLYFSGNARVLKGFKQKNGMNRFLFFKRPSYFRIENELERSKTRDRKLMRCCCSKCGQALRLASTRNAVIKMIKIQNIACGDRSDIEALE